MTVRGKLVADRLRRQQGLRPPLFRKAVAW